MFKVLFQLKWFFKENWFSYLIACTSLILASALTLIPPKILGGFVNAVYNPEVGMTLTNAKLFNYGTILIVTLVLGYIVRYTWRYFLFGAGFKLEYIYRRRFYKHLLNMDTKFYETNMVGDLMAKATVDLNQLQFSASRGILMLLEATIYLASILAIMALTIDPTLTLLAIIPLPIVILVSRFIGKRLHRQVREEQDEFGVLNDLALESVSGVRVIRAYTQEENDKKKLNDQEDIVFDKAIKVFSTHALFMITFRIVFASAYSISIIYGSKLIMDGVIDTGDLLAFSMYLGMLGWPMMAFGQMVNILQRGSASYDRINTVFSSESEVVFGEEKVDSFNEIEFNDYSFEYPLSEDTDIKNISFKIDKGETVGIVGKTGSGKSTIVKQLLRYYKYGEGKLTLNGLDIKDYDLKELRSLFGYVPQDHVLFSRTVEENIKMSAPESDGVNVERAIDSADFRKDIQFLNEGLETMAGEDGVMLSGGQKQRLQIARALLKDPEILILDDSLSAVDGETESTILENLRKERNGKTNIIIAHRLSAVIHADKIIVMDEGKVVDSGTHSELIEKDGWYASQYHIQQMEE
jgi:ABC-type multidrug transport system fused ATPase/permease subunit